MNSIDKIIAGTAFVVGLGLGAYGLVIHNKDVEKSSLYLLLGDDIAGLSAIYLITNKKTEDYTNKIKKNKK